MTSDDELAALYNRSITVTVNANQDDPHPDQRHQVYIYYNIDDEADVTHVQRRTLQEYALTLRDDMKASKKDGIYKYTGADAIADVADFSYSVNEGERVGSVVEDLGLVLAGRNWALDEDQTYYVGNAFGDIGFKPEYKEEDANQTRHFFGFLLGAYSFGSLVYFSAQNRQDIQTQNHPDLALTKAAVQAAYRIKPHVGMVDSRDGVPLGDWIRENLKE